MKFWLVLVQQLRTRRLRIDSGMMKGGGGSGIPSIWLALNTVATNTDGPWYRLFSSPSVNGSASSLALPVLLKSQ